MKTIVRKIDSSNAEDPTQYHKQIYLAFLFLVASLRDLITQVSDLFGL